MNTFTLIITEQNRILTLKSDIAELGSQYDNQRQRFVFIRPEGYEEYNLILLFTTSYKKFEPYNVGLSSEFIITNALTLGTSLRLWIGFSHGAAVEYSNPVDFTLRASAPQSIPQVEPWPEPVKELAAGAFAGASLSGNKLSFLNMNGEEIASIPITSGASNIEELAASDEDVAALLEGLI